MTVKQWSIKRMTDNGLSQNEAEEVFDALKQEKAAERVHWNDDISDYPAVLLKPLNFAINIEATKWIEQNCPEAWFKAMFANE